MAKKNPDATLSKMQVTFLNDRLFTTTSSKVFLGDVVIDYKNNTSEIQHFISVELIVNLNEINAIPDSSMTQHQIQLMFFFDGQAQIKMLDSIVDKLKREVFW